MKKSFKKYENLGLPGGPNELKRFTNGFIISERGQWDYPGQPTAVPTPSGRITMKGVENNLLGIDNLGNSQYMTPGNEYQFEGDMVYEIPQAKRGGGKKPSKKYSRSLMAKNKLFAKNPLLKKPRSVKNKIFDPNSVYFQPGGETEAMNAMMKARLAYANEFGNPAAKRMIVTPDQPYDFGDGNYGTHYMASMDNYSVPQIQDENGQLALGDYGPESNEAIRFDRPEDAEYFAENYKSISPGFMDVELDDNEIEEYRKGGYIVEDISVPLLSRMDSGGSKPKKDKWGRSSGSKWYGFNPDTKEWTLGMPTWKTTPTKSKITKEYIDENPDFASNVLNMPEVGTSYTRKRDKWGRPEGDKWYQYDPKKKGWIDDQGRSYEPRWVWEEEEKNREKNKSWGEKMLEGFGAGLNAADEVFFGSQEERNKEAAREYKQKLYREYKNTPKELRDQRFDVVTDENGKKHLQKSPEFMSGPHNNYNDGPIQPVYPEWLFIGPAGAGKSAVQTLGKSTFKALNNINKFGASNLVPKYFTKTMTLAEQAALKERLSPFTVGNILTAESVSRIPEYGSEIIEGKDVTSNILESIASMIPLTKYNQLTKVKNVRNTYNLGKYGTGLWKDPNDVKDQYKFYRALGALTGHRDGGEFEVELDDKDIETYIKNGYVVEDVLDKKQEGGSVSGTEGLTDDFNQRLTRFILDARSQGIDLGVGSGYRSYEKQKRLWEQALKKYGSPEKARKWVAPPGGSFHNKGLAVDLNSGGQFLGKDKNSKATDWAHANAKKYGLHFRMGHEPWHIEPIEKSKSSSEKENEHDDVHDQDFGSAPHPTTKEERDLMLKTKEIEFQQKQQLLAEQERIKNDDDYSNWTPDKANQVIADPREEQLKAYSQIITPSSQNIYQLYNAKLQGKMKKGGFIMDLDDYEIEQYKNGGYIIEELPRAQGGIQVETPLWSDISHPAFSNIESQVPEITRVINESRIASPIVKEVSTVNAQPIVSENKIEKTLEEVKAEARNTLGPNAIFEYDGRKYGTNDVGEDFNPSDKTLQNAGLNTENVKQNIKEQNKELNDPYISKKTVKLQEKEYEDWDKLKEKNIELNKSSNANKIIKYKSDDKSGKNYVIIDKKKGLLHIYAPGNDKPIFSAPVDLGANVGDAQTVTKVRDTNGDGVIDNIEAQKAKADFDRGNKMTGAGKYYISNIDPKGYDGLPLFNMMNESQYSNYLKTGNIDNVATSFHKGYISDDNSRVSNGCIRCNKTTLDNLNKYLQNSSEIYVLPEDEGNNFVYENGQLNFKVKNKGNLYTYKDNGKVYKKENDVWYVAPKVGTAFTKIDEDSRIKELNKNATNAGYNFYVDSHGKVQKGQGVNKGPSLNYIPIKTTIDEERFRNEKFTAFDFGDEKELKNVKSFTKSLQDNKQKIMKAAKINGDVYNEIAKISFGIFGTESNYADTHSAVGNLARAANKYMDPSGSSSPDYQSKYSTYGANQDYRSVGPTQMRWSYLNADEKKALREVGITDNSQLMSAHNAALATAVVLGVRYNQQLNDAEKKDIWRSLPKTWNTRANYSDRVKDNSKYLILEQKNIKDPKLIAKSSSKKGHTYKGRKTTKTASLQRSKTLGAKAGKLKKFIS